MLNPGTRRTPPGRRRLAALAIAAVVMLVAASCQPAPPPPPPGPSGPDIMRAQVFAGLGAWWDVWDWSPTFNNAQLLGAVPPLRIEHVDRLAATGVQTLYIQTATHRHPDVVLDRALLTAIIARAKAAGIRVVGWYLPEFHDIDHDMARLLAMARLGVDGIGVDIESAANRNVADRSKKLIEESRRLRAAFPTTPLASIPVSPVIWEVLNRGWWPNFPYVEMSKYYDAWMPMSYWSNRSAASGWNDPYRHTVESVVRLRNLTRRADLPVHPIGGQAKDTTAAGIVAMNRALVDTRSIGGSLYDDNSTPDALREPLRAMRRAVK